VETAAHEHALLCHSASGLGWVATLAGIDHARSVIVLHVFHICVAVRWVIVSQSPCPAFFCDVIRSKCLGLFVYCGVFLINALWASLTIGLVIH